MTRQLVCSQKGVLMPHFPTLLTGRNFTKLRQLREREPSIINEKTIAGFAARG